MTRLLRQGWEEIQGGGDGGKLDRLNLQDKKTKKKQKEKYSRLDKIQKRMGPLDKTEQDPNPDALDWPNKENVKTE